MAGSKTIFHDKAGYILIEKVRGIKNLNISIKPFSGVRVTIPYRMNFTDAESYILRKEAWILKNIEKIKNIENSNTVFDFATPFKTRFHTLKLDRHAQHETVRIRVDKQFIHIIFPEETAVSDPIIQHFIRQGIEKTLMLEAKTHLPGKVSQLAQQHGFSFNKLSFRNSKTRWGSCSGRNNITLSCHLMRIPEHLCDYVILHELCHTVHKNHGPGFWRALDKLTGNARNLARELKQYRIEIY